MQGKAEASSIDFTLQDPSGKTYEIQVSPSDSPIDLKAYLSDFAPLSYYTNYSLETNGEILQDYIEFSEQSISSTVSMKFNSYNERSSKAHIKRLKDLLHHPPSVTCQVVKSSPPIQELQGKVEESLSPFSMEALILQPLVKSPSSLNPWSDEEETVEIPSCLSLLTLSEFNPPNAKRRLAGDLLYLVVRTLEGNVVHVTCAVNGFWVNSSESGKSFKPDPSSESFASKTLPDLLCKLSAGFAAAFSKLLNIGAEWNSIRNLPSVLPCPAWQVNSVDEDSGSFFDPDGFVLRDWNEEFQMVRSLPSETPIQRIQRDKAMGKIYSDFLEAAVSGAKNVVHGCVQSLNPMDTGTQQLFVYNHIFFSFTEDLEYIQQQGPEASFTHVSANLDLRSLKILNSLELPSLHSIFSCIVDYRGHRVLCQSIIPGILNQNPQTTALYGSIDDGQTVSTDPAFHELMKGICEKLYIDKSVLIDKSGNKHELWGALDTKGIKGSDQRMYFLEALRLTPRDTNYLGEQFSLCLLRPELIEQYQQVMQNKFVEEKMKEAVAGKTPEESKITWEDLQEIIKSYQKVTFNPNVMTSCQFADEDPKRLENIEALSKFVLTNQVPSLAKLLVSEDGCWSKLSNSLSELFHRFGVNLRYIGKVCDLLSQEEHRHIKWTLERYAAVRSSKHIFNKILRETPDLYLAETFASLLNALVPAQPSKPQDNKKKRKRKRGKKDELKDLITMNKPEEQDPENIWKTIQQFTLSHFGVTLPSKFAYWEAVGSAGLLLAFKKDICLALGAQVDQTANLSQRISPNNVLGFVVKTKTLEWRSVESRWLFETGIKSISEQSLDPGMDMLVQSAAIQAQVSGTLNAEVASIYQKISQIYFSQNQNNKAIKFQHSAVCIYEKVLGIDHPVVGNSYINLACYYQTAGKFKRSLRLYSHALQVFMRNFGEMCPEVVVVLVSLGILYGDTGMHEVSIGLLSHVINLCLALYGEKSLFVAEYSHILAAEYKLLKEFPAAQQSERRALEIMKTHFPPDDRRIKESEGFLEELSRQIRDGNLDQTKPKDTKAYLKQRLNARKMKAKLGIPTHQLHMAYPQMDNREEETIRARQLTEQLQRRYQAS